MTLRAAGLAGLAVGAAAGAAAYIVALLATPASPWPAALMVGALSLALPSAILLGAGRRGRRPWIVTGAAFVFLVMAGALTAALLLPPEPADARLIGGLPLRLALIVYGIGLLPVLVLPAAFALDFDPTGLDPDGLARFRAECERIRNAP